MNKKSQDEFQGQTAAELIIQSRDDIIEVWGHKVRSSLPDAKYELQAIIVDTLPEFLSNLAQALSPQYPKEYASENSTIAQAHGRIRAGLTSYSLGQVIEEYQILREVLFDVLEEKSSPNPRERGIVHKSIDQAIAEAATAFTQTYGEMREQFMAVLTHDLRSPLSAVKTMAQMILRFPEKTDKSEMYAAKIVDNVNRMDNMIQDLLDSSRLRAGELLILKIQECDLGKLVTELVHELALAHGMHRFNLECDRSLHGHCCCENVRRAIVNMIGNAIKYGDPQAPISIRAESSHERIRISVHNEGNPIPPQEQATLFRPYRRASSAGQGGKEGWGLGLALVKGVAQAHGGSVVLESSPEKGTTFILDILKDARKMQEKQHR